MIKSVAFVLSALHSIEISQFMHQKILEAVLPRDDTVEIRDNTH